MAASKNIESISRAAAILKCLSSGIDQISKISTNVGLSGSTTHRILKTLQKEGFVGQDPLTLRYFLGPLLPYLSASPQSSHQSLIVQATDQMKHLRSLTGETLALVIIKGVQRLQLEELPGVHELKYSVGRRVLAPLYAGAAGKILLSQLDDEEISKILDASELIPVGPKTITNRKKLWEEIKKARKQGYAVSCGEIVAGVAALAVPIQNYFIPVAMCILAPESRFSRKKMMDVFPELKSAAMNIEKRLGALNWKSLYHR
jgi:DNA-binding IclR family transcriptional regulator